MGIGRAATATLSSSRRTTAFAPSTATDIAAPRSGPSPVDPLVLQCNGSIAGDGTRIGNGRSDQFAAEHGHGPADEDDPRPFDADPDHPPRRDRWWPTSSDLAEASPPVRPEAAVGRAADRILVDADPGAKNREAKSNAGSADRLVTITPRHGRAASLRMSGADRDERRLVVELDQEVEAIAAGEADRRRDRGFEDGPLGGRGRPPTRRPRAGSPARCRAARGRPSSTPLRVSNRMGSDRAGRALPPRGRGRSPASHGRRGQLRCSA